MRAGLSSGDKWTIANPHEGVGGWGLLLNDGGVVVVVEGVCVAMEGWDCEHSSGYK